MIKFLSLSQRSLYFFLFQPKAFHPFSTSAIIIPNEKTNFKGDGSQAIKNERTGNLPDIWTLTEKFSCDNPLLKYCTDHKRYYYYNKDHLIWQSLNDKDVQRLFINWIKDTLSNYKKFPPRRTEEALVLLESLVNFSLPHSKLIANKEGFLIPFKNGVLNCQTLIFRDHSSEDYFTHVIPVDYKEGYSLAGTPFAEFLLSITNYNKERLNILRAVLKIIFTNNLIYQVALYIHGPGGTGKSTLTGLLLYLLGPEASISTDLNSINSRFGLANIVNKLLIVFNDISLYRGKEPSKLKELISSDTLNIEQKYKDIIQVKPSAFVILTSNHIWELKNSSTGISRRVIYFPFDNIPQKRIFDLFYIDRLGQASGRLIEYIPSLIQWVLSCPDSFLERLSEGGEKTSEIINAENQLLTNPLGVWINERLNRDSSNKVAIGYSKSGEKTLYGNYLNWAKLNALDPIKANQFSSLLSDQLRSLGWNIFKKRETSGNFIYGVSLKSVKDYSFESSKINNQEWFNTEKYHNETILSQLDLSIPSDFKIVDLSNNKKSKAIKGGINNNKACP